MDKEGSSNEAGSQSGATSNSVPKESVILHAETNSDDGSSSESEESVVESEACPTYARRKTPYE